MAEQPERGGTAITANPDAQLVLARHQPAVVDPTTRTVTLIDQYSGQPTGETACIDNDPADTTVTVGSSTSRPEIYTVSGQDGALRITNLSTGDCHSLISIGPPGSTFGDPVEAAGRLYIPDIGTGKVVIVDLDRGTSITTEQVTDPQHHFDLIGRDGFVFYNDRANSKAGVVRTDGTVRAIAKYDTNNPSKGVHQPDPQPTDEAALSITAASASATDNSAPATLTPVTVVDSTGLEPTSPDQPLPSTAPPPLIPSIPSSTPPPPPSSSAAPPPWSSTSLPPPPPPASSSAASSSNTSPTSESSVSSPSPSPSPTPTPQHTLTVSVVGAGSVRDPAHDIDCPDSNCIATVDEGTPITLTAQTADQISWSGACSGTSTSCALTVTSDTTVGVTFTPRLPKLTITLVGQGKVTNSATADQLTGPGSLPPIDLPSGSAVSLSAINNDPSNWIFTGWSGDCGGSGACSVTMNSDKAVTATFSPASQDCVSFNPLNLQIVDLGADGWRLIDGSHWLQIMDNRADAEAALAVAEQYNKLCFIGRDNHRSNRMDYIVEFWEGGIGQAPVVPNQDCIPYSVAGLQIVDLGMTGWRLTDGFSAMLILDNQADAQAALAMANRHSNQCFIGRNNHRPNRSTYIIEYWR